MSNSTFTTEELDVVEELKSFLYTPYGAGTLAGAAVILTSILWALGCCLYCCCRRKCCSSGNHEGTLEAGREIEFFSTLTLPTSQQQQQQVDGTLSSGYNTGPHSHSLNSQSLAVTSTPGPVLTTSLDYIVGNEA